MKMILAILFLITAVVSVEESETKISTTRNEYRTAICEYYSTTYTTA